MQICVPGTDQHNSSRCQPHANTSQATYCAATANRGKAFRHDRLKSILADGNIPGAAPAFASLTYCHSVVRCIDASCKRSGIVCGTRTIQLHSSAQNSHDGAEIKQFAVSKSCNFRANRKADAEFLRFLQQVIPP